MADLVGRMYEAIDEGDHTGLDLLLNAQVRPYMLICVFDA